MSQVEGSIPRYNEHESFNHSFEEEAVNDNDETPMLPSVLAANTLTITDNNVGYIRGSSDMAKIIFLTICLAGLQFTWSVEMAYGTPYLLSLGLSKSFMSLVWIAGPLSGLIMQPVVGVISDSCRSKWGRRRPFLLGGSVIVVISLLMIGWTREITTFLTNETEGDTFKTVSIIIAVSSIYILDFSINCVQASCRALIVDSLPTSQQEDGTAWAGRMVGLGSVVGYFMGYADLVRVFPFLGNTQLKVLCVFAVLALIGCDFITCYAVKEKVYRVDYTNGPKKSSSPFALFSDIYHNIWNLPKPIQRICNVQFFAWIGWFPFLFYSTTWVAEIYSEKLVPEIEGEDKVGQATRAGSFAFLIYSLVSLASSFLLPLFVSPSSSKHESQEKVYTVRLFGKIELKLNFLQHLKLSFLTLPRAWTLSHFIFCIAMLSTYFVSDVTAAAIVIGVCGISWSISMWAPFSLLGEYISEQETRASHLGPSENESSEGFQYRTDMMASRTSFAGITMVGTEPTMYHRLSGEQDIEMSGIKETNEPIEEAESSNTHDIDQNTNHTPAAGVLLGIHNMYIVLPQFLVTFLSSIVFRILESNEESSDAIGVILRFGAVMAGIAGYLNMKIKN